ncbi:hypothetical protein [Diaphorobacter aerolatus]|uniref:Uncharacterized protein n=1 Tax=Diaphorobacter aerolatus TaxID=1288495 RepID=A0A7H0GIN4_9BURK|nr:hypothetical protein [Diaphorobacter aerolatus]QNP48150.1 hypothetical protein H9K75_19240 [Diaphorobacter aerolatus]
MSDTEESIKISNRRRIALSWPTALSLLTALVAAGTVTLHLIGDVRHRQYLKYWNVDAGLFPKTADWILINGYYGVVDRFIYILAAVFDNLYWLFIATIISGLYLFILLSPTAGASGEAPAWLLRQPEWRRRLIRQMLLTALFMSVMPCALFLLTAFMVVPAALGETAGKAAAESDLAEYMKGCQTSKIPCVELQREGTTIATGFVLDSSPSHIAIFDAQAQRGRVLALEKIEVLSSRAPSLKEKIAR